MKNYSFTPKINKIGQLDTERYLSVIKHEPMLFAASYSFAEANGGPLTKSFLYSLIDKDIPLDDLIIDTRVHMLMKGWFPCIPGWHHDDVIRTRQDGQPDYDHPNALKPEHIVCVVDGGTGSMTEFISSELTMTEVPVDKVVYKEWNSEINNDRINDVSIQTIKNGEILQFNTETFHRGVSAVGNGFRWFCRASFNSTRTPANEIRQNANVYMSNLNEGW